MAVARTEETLNTQRGNGDQSERQARMPGGVVLHRDNPDREPLTGHIKVTREDWLNVSRDLLISDGVGSVKVQTIGRMLGVSRSSFYWYFTSRNDLLEQLLNDWEESNTRIIIQHSQMPAGTITGAVLNFFRCIIDGSMFNPQLDFAVREWARRDDNVRRRVDLSDAKRLNALTAMYSRYGFSHYEAEIRARILYFMQLGYHALEVSEEQEERLVRLEGYVLGFTGQEAAPGEIEEFRRYVRRGDKS